MSELERGIVSWLVAAVAFLLVGCGGWQSVHAPLGTAFAEASTSGEALLLEAMTEDMRSSGQAARDAGGDDVAVIAAVDAATDRWACPRAAFNIFAGRVNAYLSELVAALGEDREPDLVRVVADLRAALEAYRAATACTDLDLPELPAIPEGWL